jgi:hypothetical protein
MRQEDQAEIGAYIPVTAFGICSMAGRVLCFHVMAHNGAQIARVPIHKLRLLETGDVLDNKADYPVHFHQPWDCFSYEFSVTEFDYLAGAVPEIRWGLSKLPLRGRYLFTVDWFGTAQAEGAGEEGHKNAHVIALLNGRLVAMPNNLVRWHVAALGEPFPWDKRPDWQLVLKPVPSSEASYARGADNSEGWAYEGGEETPA